MKVIPKLLPMTPYEVYLQQVGGTFEAVRAAAKGMSYIPPQFGGLIGQRTVANDGAVLELISFSISATDTTAADVVKSNSSESKYKTPVDPNQWITEAQTKDLANGSSDLDVFTKVILPQKGYF